MFDDVFLNSFIKTALVPIQDLSWLDIDEEEYQANEPLPDNKKKLNCKDQLKNLWDHHQNFRGPTEFTLTPAHAKEALPVSETHKASVLKNDVSNLLKKVRLAISEGKIGKELVEFIQHNFSSDVVTASTQELKSLSQEYGLLGFAYIDPIVYDCQKLKESSLRKNFPEVTLKRDKCASCKFNSNDLCLKFELPLVTNISFNEDLVKKLSKKLETLGYVFKTDATLKPSEQIRKIFLTKQLEKTKALTVFPKHDVAKIIVGDQAIKKFVTESTRESVEQIHDSSTKEKYLRSLVKKLGKQLKSIGYNFEAGAKLAPNEQIREAFQDKEPRQGVVSTKQDAVQLTANDQQVDRVISSVSSVEDISQFIKQSFEQGISKKEVADRLKDHFTFEDLKLAEQQIRNLFKTLSSDRKKVAVISEDLDADPIVSKIVQSLNSGARISAIKSKVATMVPQTQVLPLLKRAFISKIKSSLKQGVSINKIKLDFENLASGSEIISLLKEGFTAAPIIHTQVFEYCKKLGAQGYKLSKSANLQSKDSCTDCLFNCKVYCTKLGRKFSNQAFKIKDAIAPDATAQEVTSFFDNSGISLKMSPEIKPTNTEIEGLNEFTIP